MAVSNEKRESALFYGHSDPKIGRSETTVVDMNANSDSFVGVTKKAILL